MEKEMELEFMCGKMDVCLWDAGKIINNVGMEFWIMKERKLKVKFGEIKMNRF